MPGFGICLLSLAPLRTEPSERSEMSSQFLFGDRCEILEERKAWLKVRMAFDTYEGWVAVNQLHRLDEEGAKRHSKGWDYYLLDFNTLLREENQGNRMQILMGSSLPRISRGHFKVGPYNFTCDARLKSPVSKTDRKSLLTTARKYLGAPYLWGGRSPFGIDCSGFTQMVFRINGIALPRDARQQASMGHTLGFVSEALPGDLAFFEDENGAIVHTGIILDGGKIIHASGKVRIDALDHHGIFVAEERRYTHRLRLVNSIMGD